MQISTIVTIAKQDSMYIRTREIVSRSLLLGETIRLISTDSNAIKRAEKIKQLLAIPPTIEHIFGFDKDPAKATVASPTIESDIAIVASSEKKTTTFDLVSSGVSRRPCSTFVAFTTWTSSELLYDLLLEARIHNVNSERIVHSTYARSEI